MKNRYNGSSISDYSMVYYMVVLVNNFDGD